MPLQAPILEEERIIEITMKKEIAAEDIKPDENQGDQESKFRLEVSWTVEQKEKALELLKDMNVYRTGNHPTPYYFSKLPTYNLHKLYIL